MLHKEVIIVASEAVRGERIPVPCATFLVHSNFLLCIHIIFNF